MEEESTLSGKGSPGKAVRLLDGVLKFGGYVSAGLVVFVTILLLYEVLTRYVLHRPSIWTLDTATYALLYLAMAGAPWLLKEDGHVKIEIITARFTRRGRAMFTGVTSLVASASCGIFCWQATVITCDAYKIGYFVDRSMPVPRYLLTWVIAFSTFLLCVQFARSAYEYIRYFLETRTGKQS